MNLSKLSKTDLDIRIKSLAAKERDLLHEILLTIKEIDLRRTYLELGYPSLFEYLTQGVGYSAGSAQRRIDGARLLQELPELGEKIQSGELKLNQVSLLQKTTRNISRKLSQPVSKEEKTALVNELLCKSHQESEKTIASFFDLPVLETVHQKTQSDGSVRLELTLSKELHDKIQKAQELLSHSIPTKDLIAYLDYITDKVIQQRTLAQNKHGKKKSETDSGNSTATVAVNLTPRMKKMILNRDLCCQYKDPVSGKVCGSKWFLQVDHKTAKWAGGDHRAENLQALCANHNQLKYRKETNLKYIS